MTCHPPIPQTVSPYAQDFILRLLHKDPSQRLGAGTEGFREIKAHGVFKVSGLFLIALKMLLVEFLGAV